MFEIVSQAIDEKLVRSGFKDHGAGGLVVFEGRVRNVNDGRPVNALEYEIYHELCRAEADVILGEAKERYRVIEVFACHREGLLGLGDIAVWIGVSARHRDDAFKACRYIIDEIKHRLPIWKKEHYADGPSEWIDCQGCATHVPFTEKDFYSRQSHLPQVGEEGQSRLRASRALVVGCGGLGVPVLTALTAAGVGEIVIVDDDSVDISNLHRQTLYRADQVGLPKASLAADSLKRLNPFVSLRSHVERVTRQNAVALIQGSDIVIDCTDNFQTKFLLQDACSNLKKPLFTASIHRFDGTLHVYVPGRQSACLRCLWPKTPEAHCVSACADAGVLAAAVGSLGHLQALEVIKYILSPSEYKWDGYVTVDLWNLQVSRINLLKASDCPLCSKVADGYSINTSSKSIFLDPVSDAHDELELSPLGLKDRQVVLLDIREDHERRETQAVLSMMRHVPLSIGDFKAHVPVTGDVVLVCQGGVRSLRKVRELRDEGFLNVYSLRGGISSAQSIKEAHHGCRH